MEDYSIIIYNSKIFQPDFTIKEHNNVLYCITQLSSAVLFSYSGDKSIKLSNIKEKE